MFAAKSSITYLFIQVNNFKVHIIHLLYTNEKGELARPPHSVPIVSLLVTKLFKLFHDLVKVGITISSENRYNFGHVMWQQELKVFVARKIFSWFAK